MDQNVQYFECLERVTREMVSPEQIRVDKIVADLQELCKLLRVCKGVTTFYNSIALERRGEGDTYIPYDTGVESDKAVTLSLTIRLYKRYHTLNLDDIYMLSRHETEDR